MRSLPHKIVRLLMAFAIVMCAPIPTFAGLRMHGAGGGSSCPYGTDNGCAASTTYIAAPTFQDATFAFDGSQSGQCTSPCTGSNLAARNGYIHAASANIPGVDYKVGSANPATLTPISSWASDGICAYQSSGAKFGNGPRLLCVGTESTTGVQETIQGYDFTNGGTTCVLMEITDNGSLLQGVQFNLINDYFKASGSCFSGLITGTLPAFVYYHPSYQTIAATYYFHNVTMDGNYAAAPDNAHGIIIGFSDDRRGVGASGTVLGAFSDYSVYENLGHDPFISSTGANTTLQYNVFWNDCLSGTMNCHGEIEENTWPLSHRTVVYNGNLIFGGSTSSSDPLYSGTNIDWTSPLYISTGVESGTIFDSVTLNNNVIVFNNQLCNGSAPYSPSNVCAGASSSLPVGSILFSVQNPPYVGTMHVHNNVVDNTAAYSCYKNFASSFSTMVGSTSGTVLSITTPNSDYTASPGGGWVSTLWPGLEIYDTNVSDGFVTTTIASNGTYSNTVTFGSTLSASSMVTDAPVTLVVGSVIAPPSLLISQGQNVFSDAAISGGSGTSWTFFNGGMPTGHQQIMGTNNTSSCTPGTNIGCGTLTLSATQPTKTITGTFKTQAGIMTPDFGADNYAIGGANNPGARLLTFGALPWSGISGDGSVACP